MGVHFPDGVEYREFAAAVLRGALPRATKAEGTPIRTSHAQDIDAMLRHSPAFFLSGR